MKVPNPRLLRTQYSQAEWVEMLAYLRIRGPMGPPRWDYYAGSTGYRPFDPPWNVLPLSDGDEDDDEDDDD